MGRVVERNGEGGGGRRRTAGRVYSSGHDSPAEYNIKYFRLFAAHCCGYGYYYYDCTVYNIRVYSGDVARGGGRH